MLLVSRCRACDAPIVWAVTSAGKQMPVDATPNVKGNIVLYEDRGGKPLALVVESGRVSSDAPRYVSHFATCPKADQFRKSLARKAIAEKPRRKTGP